MRCDIYHSITYNGGNLNMQKEEKGLYIMMCFQAMFNDIRKCEMEEKLYVKLYI